MESRPPPYRIVIVSQNASTRFGGEAILPVHYFRILRKRGADVHLVAHERNRADLTRYFDGEAANMTFVADTPVMRGLARFSKHESGTMVGIAFYNFAVLYTEWLQRRHVRALLAERPHAIVHAPTPVSPRAVSLLSGLRAPVVFGPMNGGMAYPPGYTSHRSPARQRLIGFARRASILAHLALPAKRRAARLLVANARSAAALPVTRHERVVTLTENGVEVGLWHPRDPAIPRAPGPFRLVYVGRLVPLKALDVTLRALAAARARGVEATLDIIGGGPERDRLGALAAELGCEHSVSFHDFMPQPKVAEFLRSCDALILNSLIECGGAVVLEAMATGLPVIASAWGGPLDYLDETCGILVHPSPPATFADRLADAIETLATDPDLGREMGAAGLARIKTDFDWERKVDRILEIFDDLLPPG